MKSNSQKKNLKDEIVDSALRQGELYLQEQSRFALAADQRAITLGTCLLTLASLMLIYNLIIWPPIKIYPILITGLLGSIYLIVLATFCFFSAKPVDFYHIGNDPLNWLKALEHDVDISEIKTQQANLYSKYIHKNKLILEKNTKLFNYSMTGIILFIPFLIIVLLISYFLNELILECFNLPTSIRSAPSLGVVNLEPNR